MFTAHEEHVYVQDRSFIPVPKKHITPPPHTHTDTDTLDVDHIPVALIIK